MVDKSKSERTREQPYIGELLKKLIPAQILCYAAQLLWCQELAPVAVLSA